jgi:hypothetical protein
MFYSCDILTAPDTTDQNYLVSTEGSYYEGPCLATSSKLFWGDEEIYRCYWGSTEIPKLYFQNDKHDFKMALPFYANVKSKYSIVYYPSDMKLYHVKDDEWELFAYNDVDHITFSYFNGSTTVFNDYITDVKFIGCKNINSMYQTFWNNPLLANIDLSLFKPEEEITNYSSCFNNTAVTTLNLDTFNYTANSIRFQRMFANNPNLECISYINTTNKEAYGTDEMFDNCPNLTAPDSNEQQQLIDGAIYVNSCP